MKPIRQGDVILFPVKQAEGRKLIYQSGAVDDLTLAEGEVTGHKHCITQGDAQLYTNESCLYLSIISEKAVLSHEEHGSICVPQGYWMVRVQREYEPEGWRYVAD